jgi:hypothetical protein
LNTRVSEEMADVLVDLVGLADQCWVVSTAALEKIAASAKSTQGKRTAASLRTGHQGTHGVTPTEPDIVLSCPCDVQVTVPSRPLLEALH